MRARILAGGHRASPGFSFTRAISTLVLLIVTNYLTFYASGGVSRLGLSAATGGARSESGAAAHLRDHHGGKGAAVAAPRGAPRAAAGNAVAPAPLAADAATAVAIVPRGRPVVSSPLAEFCTAADPPDMSPAVAAEATKRQWDAVASWPHAEMMKLFSYKCFLTSLRHSELRFIPVHICTHDPELDGVMAASFHKWGWWGANADHRFVCVVVGVFCCFLTHVARHLHLLPTSTGSLRATQLALHSFPSTPSACAQLRHVRALLGHHTRTQRRS